VPSSFRVNSDVRKATLVLKIIQEQNLPAIVKAQNEAVSTLLQVLYFLQQGHVQFLIGDYKARVIDAHGADASDNKRNKAPKLGKDGRPRAIHDVNESTPTPGQIVDMSQNDDEGAMDPDDEGSGIHFNRDG
jgi:hypothetical protein